MSSIAFHNNGFDKDEFLFLNQVLKDIITPGRPLLAAGGRQNFLKSARLNALAH